MPCVRHPVFAGCCFHVNAKNIDQNITGSKEDWREYAGQIYSRRGEGKYQ